MLFSIRSPLALTVPGKMTYASVLAIVKSNEIALLVPDGAQPANCNVVLPVIVCSIPQLPLLWLRQAQPWALAGSRICGRMGLPAAVSGRAETFAARYWLDSFLICWLIRPPSL